MDSLKFFYKYPKFVNILYNVKHHMEFKNKDFPIAIVGPEGVGKSNFLLHFYELWYRVILKRSITPADIKNIHINRNDWVKNFKGLEPLNINAWDEAANGLSSKQTMEKFNRMLETVFKTIRKRKLVAPMLIPNYFDLNKYFRSRIRMLISIETEGSFSVYSYENLKWIEARNTGKNYKRLNVVKPFYNGVFPIYDGILLEAYNEMAWDGVENILDDTILELEGKKKSTKEQVMIYNMSNAGMTQKEIGKYTGYSQQHISRTIKEYMNTLTHNQKT